MNIIPFNRYLLVSPINEQEQENNLAIVLPTGYKKAENPYTMCSIMKVSKDSKYYGILNDGDRVIVEGRMINKIEFSGKSSYLVLENYIYGRIDNETK